MTHALGIDLGTSEVKLLLLDKGGSVVGQAGAALDVQRPQPLWSEQDPEAWWQMAPFVHVKPDHPPVFIATSQFEPYYYSWPSVALLEALVKVDRRMPRFRFLPGHNHASSALQINCAIDTLGPDLLAFVESVTSSR